MGVIQQQHGFDVASVHCSVHALGRVPEIHLRPSQATSAVQPDKRQLKSHVHSTPLTCVFEDNAASFICGTTTTYTCSQCGADTCDQGAHLMLLSLLAHSPVNSASIPATKVETANCPVFCSVQ